MLKMVNCVNLIELLPNGEKAIIQKPQQIELIKKMLLDYNRGALDYENIDLFIIDAGAGGKICCREIGRPILKYIFNCWNHLKLSKLQHKDEISLSVNV